MSDKSLGPCPIPRCALEWYLGIMLIVIGVQLGFFTDAAIVSRSLALTYTPIDPKQWCLFIIVPGILQLACLVSVNRALQRWSALLSFIVCLLIADIMLTERVLPILGSVFLVQTVGELYVFLMLRGARWSFSKSFYEGSVGSGSSAQPS